MPSQITDRWVDALNKSPTIQNQNTWQALIAELPQEIRNALTNSLPTLETQLRDLVWTCQNYLNGLNALVEAIRNLEGNSSAVKQLELLLISSLVRNLENNILIIEAILAAQPQIAESLGDEWPEFQTQLLEILAQLAQAEDEQIDELVTELLFLGWQTPAAAIFRRIMNTYQDETGLMEVSRSAGQFAISPDTPLSTITPDQFRSEVQRIVLAEKVEGSKVEGSIVSGKISVGGDFVGRDQIFLEKAINIVPAAIRYLNAGFFTAAGAYITPDTPLSLDRAPYQLRVNIGPFWGPGTADTAFPTLPDELYDEEDSLTLDLVARTLDKGLTIANPRQTLTLPRMGESPLVAFPLAIAAIGRYTIDVDVFYHGHLLQSRRTEFKVVPQAGDTLPDSAWPVQDGYITWTRAAHLTATALAPLADAPRHLTILAERDADYQRIGLHFYDSSRQSLDLQQSELTDASLTRLLTGLRRRLLNTMDQYAGGIGSSERVLAKHLGLLADAGRTFYRHLLPGLTDAQRQTEQGQQLQVALQPGAIIQVAPLSPNVSVPWELLYERPIVYQEGHTRLCTGFREHGPHRADCPHHDKPEVVCPHGFWGYRYIIEQLPCRVERSVAPPERDLPLVVRNGRPLQLAAFVYQFSGLDNHLNRLRQLADAPYLQLKTINTLAQAQAFFAGQADTPHLVYFYTHGGKNDMDDPYLQIGDGTQITANYLEGWQMNWHGYHPLVVLNACETADYSPDDYENLILFLSERGAAGVIGTQCAVREKLADAFILPFFAQFLAQMPAGEALFNARRQLLYEHLDPRGLVYSLFAAAEVKLAQPIVDS